MYLSPRFTSDSLRGLKRHITLMLHSAGSAIFLAAGADGREPLPAAQSGKKQARAEGLGSRRSKESVPRVVLFPEGAEGDGDWKRRQPRPEAHFRSIMAAKAAAAAPGGASAAQLLTSPSPAWADCRFWETRKGVTSFLESRLAHRLLARLPA